MPMSSGLRNGTYGSGAAEPSEATLATSVQSQRPAASTAAGAVRYASGSSRTGQTRAVAGRGRTQQHRRRHDEPAEPRPGARGVAPARGDGAAEQGADERERERAERVHRVRRRLRPERRGQAQHERVRGEGDRPGPPAAVRERIARAAPRRSAARSSSERRVRQRRPGDLGPVEPASRAPRRAPRPRSPATSAAASVEARRRRRRRSRSPRSPTSQTVAGAISSGSHASSPCVSGAGAAGAMDEEGAGERRRGRHQAVEEIGVEDRRRHAVALVAEQHRQRRRAPSST